MKYDIFEKFCLVVFYENSDGGDYLIEDGELFGKTYVDYIYEQFSNDLLNQFAYNLELQIFLH